MSEIMNIEQLLVGFMFMELTDRQVRDVSSYFGTAPLGFEAPTNQTTTALPDDFDLDESDVANFTAVWRQITAPGSIIIIERNADGQRYMWMLLVGRNSCVEQVRGSNGFSWLFCSTLQILGRVLLNAGLLREAPSASSEWILDPLSGATSWSVSISVIEDATQPDEMSEIRFGCEDGHWIADQEDLDRLTLIERLSSFLSNAIDESAGPTDEHSGDPAKEPGGS